MVDVDKAESGRKWFDREFAGHPASRELLQKWEALLENPAFRAHANILKAFKAGLDPIPDRDRYETLIRASGHDFAAVEVLRSTNVLLPLLGYTRISREDYFALQGTVMARLLDGRRALSEAELARLYSTMDRLLRGGLGWATTTDVPTADKQFYQALRGVRWTMRHEPVTPLRKMTLPRAKEVFGEDYRAVFATAACACTMLGGAVAVKHGASSVSVDHAIEGCLAYIHLFDTDIRGLPVVMRKGLSGYELATAP